MQRSLLTPALRLSAALQLGPGTRAATATRTAPAVILSRHSYSSKPWASSDGILPYRVGRTASKHLSVYHRIRAGGTNITTEIKKVEGNLEVLSQQLQDELKVQTFVNPRTKFVVVKGRHKDAIIAWLEQKGF